MSSDQSLGCARPELLGKNTAMNPQYLSLGGRRNLYLAVDGGQRPDMHIAKDASKCSYRVYKQFFLFFTGLIILILEIAVAAFSLDHRTFSLALTVIATATVFLVVIGVVVFDEVCQKSEQLLIPKVEESSRYRIEQVEV